MLKKELEARIISACENVIAAEPELTEIDSKFGDADHGLTMHKIAAAIKNSVTESAGDIKEMLDDAAMAVMGLNGGSAVPLWNSWLEAMFASAFEALDDMSGAKVGDKTMMDTVIPASEAIASYVGDSVSELFSVAAEAAKKGAENSKNFVSKFGRAKTFGTKTIGTPDAGATSMAKFFEGLAKE